MWFINHRGNVNFLLVCGLFPVNFILFFLFPVNFWYFVSLHSDFMGAPLKVV